MCLDKVSCLKKIGRFCWDLLDNIGEAWDRCWIFHCVISCCRISCCDDRSLGVRLARAGPINCLEVIADLMWLGVVGPSGDQVIINDCWLGSNLLNNDNIC